MLPVIAIVGRSNVGKSTLFNRLTRTRSALVADFPGLTRDRQYGLARVGDHEFICIDTAGINGEKNGIELQIKEQSLRAIEEADVVLFVVDAHVGLVLTDSAIAKYLQLHDKKTVLVANKIDGTDINQVVSDFLSLGLGQIHSIVASCGRGLNSLLKTALLPVITKVHLRKNTNRDVSHFSYFKENQEAKRSKHDQLKSNNHNPNNSLPIKLAIVGRPNVGKSTLANRILGKKRMVVCDMPGTTRDSIYIPIQHGKHKYVLIDTAGVRKQCSIANLVERFSIMKTFQAIEDAHVVLLVIDAFKGISDQEMSLLGFILHKGRSLVVVVNKWDSISNKIRNQVKDDLVHRLSFINFIRLHFISALYDKNSIVNLFKSVREAYGNSVCHYKASTLTHIMSMAEKDHQPPRIGSRRVRLKYAHSGGCNPLTVVIHGNQVNALPNCYKRYLINYFRKSLKVRGAPIIIQFKEGKNPFSRKKEKTYSSNRYIKNKNKACSRIL